METLWREGRALTPSEVRDQILGQHVVAYTTVMTVLVRLWQKGRLEREKDGRAYRYAPVESRAEYESRRMAEILRSVDNEALTLSRFVERLTPAERRWLNDLTKPS